MVGVDLDGESLALLREQLGIRNLVVGDAEHLETCDIQGRFDVVLCGDLVEHLTCPGLMLNGIKRFLVPKGTLIVSTPNSFSLMANIRFTTGGIAKVSSTWLRFRSSRSAIFLKDTAIGSMNSIRATHALRGPDWRG